MEVCSKRFRKGCISTIQGSIGRCAPDDFVNVLLGHSGIACRGLIRTISSRTNLYPFVWSKPPHATPVRRDKIFTTSSGATLDMLPRIVQIKPLRTSSGANLPVLPRIVQLKPFRNRPEQISPCCPASSRTKTFTESSRADLLMLPRIVKIKPLQNRPEQTSPCQPGSSK